MPDELTVIAALAGAAAQLHAAGIEAGAYEARLLLAHALGVTQADLLRDRTRPVPTAAFAALLARRVAREPAAAIIGHVGFWSLHLAVSTATLIPRADSETLIEAAIAAFADPAQVRRVLDLGTGSGCLLLAALSVFGNAWGLGIDRSEPACTLAAANAAANGLSTRTVLVCGNWADAVDGRFDLILANPPYIPTNQIAQLMPEVARYEPVSALDGGADGLDAFRTLLPIMPLLLTPSGRAVLEIGAGQAPAVTGLAASLAPSLHCRVRHDLGGHPRALILHADPAC